MVRVLACLIVVAGGCTSIHPSADTSIRSVEVAPTPDAVATFVAETFDVGPVERLETVPGTQVFTRIVQTWPSLLHTLRMLTPDTRALDRVETYSTDGQLVEVYVFETDVAAKRVAPDLASTFSGLPVTRAEIADSQYYIHGRLVVRVLTVPGTDNLSYRLDDGLGQPWTAGEWTSSRPTAWRASGRTAHQAYELSELREAIQRVASISAAREDATAISTRKAGRQ